MIVTIKKIQTPLGDMHAGASEAGICFLEFTDESSQQKSLDRLSKELNAEFVSGENAYIVQLEKELDDYFNKTRTGFTVPLDLGGTEFQRSVWKTLVQIPFGKTITYKQQAIQMENLPAIRAIASANGQNRHAIIIPCHRVIGSNGSLTGYAGGLEKKAWLLDFEMDKTGHTLEMIFE